MRKRKPSAFGGHHLARRRHAGQQRQAELAAGRADRARVARADARSAQPASLRGARVGGAAHACRRRRSPRAPRARSPRCAAAPPACAASPRAPARRRRPARAPSAPRRRPACMTITGITGPWLGQLERCRAAARVAHSHVQAPSSARVDVAAHAGEELAAEAVARCRRPALGVERRRLARRPLGRVDQRVERAGDARRGGSCRRRAPWPSGAAGQHLGADVDRRRHLARRAAHAAVGDQRDAESPCLCSTAERRRQLVQLGHAVGARALEAHDGDEVALQLRRRRTPRAAPPALSNTIAGASTTWRSAGTAETLITARPRLPVEQLQAAVVAERLAPRGARSPSSPLAAGSVAPGSRPRVAARARGRSRRGRRRRRWRRRRAGSRPRAARGSRSRARRRPGTGSRRRCRSDRRAPAAAPPRDSSEKSVQSMTMPAARATATQWIRWLVEPPVASSATIALTITRSSTSRPIGMKRAAARARSAEHACAPPRASAPRAAPRAGARRRRPARAGPSPRAASGCCWRCRRRCRCRGRGTPPLSACEQRVAADQALRVLLAHLGLLGVRQAAGHRPGRHEHARQVAEVQRADQQARHDLVADAEQQRGVEHVVR